MKSRTNWWLMGKMLKSEMCAFSQWLHCRTDAAAVTLTYMPWLQLLPGTAGRCSDTDVQALASVTELQDAAVTLTYRPWHQLLNCRMLQ